MAIQWLVRIYNVCILLECVGCTAQVYKINDNYKINDSFTTLLKCHSPNIVTMLIQPEKIKTAYLCHSWKTVLIY